MGPLVSLVLTGAQRIVLHGSSPDAKAVVGWFGLKKKKEKEDTVNLENKW